MKLNTLFEQKKIVFSFEVFPPKKTSSIQTIYDTLDALSDLNPDFISVTYGAGGNPADHSTVEIASTIKHKYHIEPLAHLTCLNSTKEHIGQVLNELREKGVDQADIDIAFEEYDLEVDEVGRAREEAAKVLRMAGIEDGQPVPEKIVGRIARKLQSKGYSSDTIYSIIGDMRR